MNSTSDSAARLLGQPVQRVEPVQGGDLSEVVRLHLSGGGTVIAKNGPAPRVEAAMLRSIQAADAPAPDVLAADGDTLVLEDLPANGALGPEGWARLGQAVRYLHDATGKTYGWAEDYAFDAVAIRNAPLDDWPRFWAERRLLAEARNLPADIRAPVDRLAAQLPDLLPRHPAPSLLHGDLWGGNVLAGDDGRIWLIDPACYYGHGEVDLAMLTLFNNPDRAFWDTYGAPAPGWKRRRAIYQLWPAIVHLRLFGAGYRSLVEQRLERALA